MMISRFLLASLNMDAVLAEPTIHQRRRVLHRIAKGLGLQDAYDTTLDRRGEQKTRWKQIKAWAGSLDVDFALRAALEIARVVPCSGGRIRGGRL